MKVPYFVPWITSQDKKSILKTLNQRWLTNGPNLQKFEKKFQTIIDSKFSIGVGNATQALHLAMRSLNLKSTDEVIVPTFTFAATANAVIYSGAKLVFADVDLDTFNISPKDIEKRITSKTKAIIPVHYGGQACDMKEIMAIAKKNNIRIVEDCAHSLGSKYNDKMCGNIGDIGCFSFYATKVITTAEGGMITTNNSKFSKLMKLLRSQAMSIQATEREKSGTWKYDIVDLGYNYRLDEIRSSLGLSQISRLEKSNNKRIKIAQIYDKLLGDITGLHKPIIGKNRNHIYHLYTIRIDDGFPLSRNELHKKLTEKGIGTSVQYYPLHLMSYYKKNHSQRKNNFLIATKLKDEVLSLPIFPTMKQNQIEFVVNQIKSFDKK